MIIRATCKVADIVVYMCFFECDHVPEKVALKPCGTEGNYFFDISMAIPIYGISFNCAKCDEMIVTYEKTK